jgi:hypothetical protein
LERERGLRESDKRWSIETRVGVYKGGGEGFFVKEINWCMDSKNTFNV